MIIGIPSKLGLTKPLIVVDVGIFPLGLNMPFWWMTLPLSNIVLILLSLGIIAWRI